MTRLCSWLVGAAAAFCACAGNKTAQPSEPGIAVVVSPLHIEGIVRADYHVVGKNAAGTVVWQDDITDPFDADGEDEVAVTYTGPCVAAEGPYRIELTLTALYDAVGPLDGARYLDPTATAPLVVETTCPAEGETVVTFDVTVLGVRHGFDVDVKFEDIFCSAKFDCVAEDGGPILMLHDEQTATRGPTVVLAFACTAGNGQPTQLHMNDLYVTCEDGTSYYIDPTGGNAAVDGQMGAQRPLFFERASYRGREQLPNIDKCYWNVALGVLPDATLGKRCRLEASATASSGPLAADTDPNSLTIYPFIHWQIDLADDGAIVCGKNPLGGFGSGTRAEYVEITDTPFQHTMTCDTTTITTPPRVLCNDGVQPTDDAVSVTATVGGVFVEVGSDKSELYKLPDDFDVPACCLSPCCGYGE